MSIDVAACFKFLDELRSSGEINMYGASPRLQEQFDIISPTHAQRICQQWRDTFNHVQTPAERAAQVAR